MFKQLLNDYVKNEMNDVSKFWHEVGDIRDSGETPFRLLADLALLVCVIPHSNAGAERIFSMINKNLTPQRSCLGKDTTLNNIMIIKTADLPVNFKPSKYLIKAAKSATRHFLIKK